MSRPILQAMTNRSIDWWLMSEDSSDLEKRVTLDAIGQPPIHRKPNNRAAQERLDANTHKTRREAGYRVVITETMGIEIYSHLCGDVRFGDDPAPAVLDRCCRSCDPGNLYAVDPAFFPSSSTVNPELVLAAQALGVGYHLI